MIQHDYSLVSSQSVIKHDYSLSLESVRENPRVQFRSRVLGKYSILFLLILSPFERHL